MNNEKILNDEMLSDEQLEGVAGGTYSETFGDMDRFHKETGFNFHGSDSSKREQLRDILWHCGVKIKDHGGFTDNDYYLLTPNGQKGEKVNRDTAIGYAIANYKSGKRW